MKECFQSSLDHVLAELRRIELKLHLQLIKLRRADQAGEGEFRGLYVSEGDVDTILAGSSLIQSGGSLQPDDASYKTLAESWRQFETGIAERKNESLRRGLILRLHELQQSFRLSEFDIDILLIGVLPELDLRYQRLYAYLQDDVTKKSPSVELVLNLLCESLEDKLKARAAFLAEAPLIKYQLLHLSDGPAPLLARSLLVDERIINYLLEIDQVDAQLLPFTHLRHPQTRLSDVMLADDVSSRLSQLAERFKENGAICHFQGACETSKQTTAEALCREMGLPLLFVDVDTMVATSVPAELLVPLVFREGKLHQAALYLNHCEVLLNNEKNDQPGRDTLLEELGNYSTWIFLATQSAWQPAGIRQDRPFISLQFPIPAYSLRRQIWEQQWNGQATLGANVDFNDLANKFRLTGGQIADAAAMARNLALWRDPDNGLVTSQDLYLASRQQSGQRLNALAQQIQPRYEWEDIILPKDQKELLREICNYIKHHHTVYDDWGFGSKLHRSTGLNALFAGPSGTGKTMAADIIAHELGLDLYKIDLSAIVSKYIGETEKNLDRIFREGETANAILFFDEADALFGKRSEVRDSHDRYANIEIAYLLQKMEEYDGVVILATNLRKNMDEAFARRMHFTLEFPMPEEPDRHRIWERIFPGEAPLDGGIDLTFMAHQFRISGGNIKNIALNAAFLAAEDGGSITMESLVWATKREYQKLGKLCTEDDFAHFFEIVKS